MPSLILVKHSLPDIDPKLPASAWRLSEEGRRCCAPLAGRLAAYRPHLLVSSLEPKAIETAECVAAQLGIPLETAPDLHEHDRSQVGFMELDHLHAAVADFFAYPDQLVFGSETAEQAHQRFARAVTGVLDRHPDRNVAIVAHGTVIGLFVARHNAMDPRALWQRLDLPSFVVLSVPNMTLLEVVEKIVS